MIDFILQFPHHGEDVLWINVAKDFNGGLGKADFNGGKVRGLHLAANMPLTMIAQKPI